MDFTPFQPPPSDHHPLNTGLSSENGTSAKGLVDGVNAYLKHLFGVVEGVAQHIGKHSDADDRIKALEDALATAQKRGDDLAARVDALEKLVQPFFVERAAALKAEAAPTGDKTS